MAVRLRKQIQYPFEKGEISRLKTGDLVLVSGLLFTARDRVHKHLAGGGRSPVALANGAIYHCGPVVVRSGGNWHVTAAGPTTSSRENPYMPQIILEHGVSVVIGKGGMDATVAASFRNHGCVYLHAVGGAAVLLAKTVRRVCGVHFLDQFGPTEAMWELEVKDFPAIVTMDSRGRSLHANVFKRSAREFDVLKGA